MTYLRQYGEIVGCDDLSGTVIRVIQDHKMLNLSASLGIGPRTAPTSLQAIAPPAEAPTEPKEKPRFVI